MRNFLLSIFILFPFCAIANNIEVYSCDTCNNVKALEIAKKHPPRAECRWETNRGSEVEFGNSELICVPATKSVIITNPVTRTSFKYNVKTYSESSNVRVSASPMEITLRESQLLEQFYSLDSDFREALHSLSSTKLQQSSIIWKSYSPTSGSDACTNHPVNYFKGIRQQSQAHKELTSAIESELGNSAWGDYFSNTDFTGGGVTLQKDGLGFQISLQHNEVGSFISRVYGNSLDNILVFEAKYNGDLNLNGTRRLNVSYELKKGSSFIDGLQTNLLFNGNTVDLSKTVISNCLREYIESQSSTDTDNNGGNGSGNGNGNGNGNGSGNRVCLRKVDGTTCSSAHGETRCVTQTYIITC